MTLGRSIGKGQAAPEKYSSLTVCCSSEKSSGLRLDKAQAAAGKAPADKREELGIFDTYDYSKLYAGVVFNGRWYY